MPRLLELRALAPLLMPPYALPEEDGRLDEEPARLGEALGEGDEREAEGAGRDAPVDAVGRLADGVPPEGRAAAVPVEGRAPAVPVEGRAPVLPVEGRVPPEPQPRASELRAEVAAVGEPLLARRLWSGCHFFWPPVDYARLPWPPLRLTFLFTFLSTSMSTSP